MAVKAAAKRKSGRMEELNVGWQPGERVLHGLLLEAILKDNPIPLAYRMNYIANFYVGPLVAMMERSFKLTRSEWIVLFCLTRQPRLNAQQISIVTGRPKTSIASAVKLLQKKGLITRKTDIADSRRRVLHLSDSGQRIYTAIRLGRYFRTDPHFWLNLQAAHDLSKAEKAHNYKKIVPRRAA